MRLGLGLAITDRRPGGGDSTVDPAALDLSLLHLTSYGGSPWLGTASLGASGTNDLTEATNPPGVGAAQGGYTPGDLDGVNDLLSADDSAPAMMPGASGVWSVFALLRPDALPADSGNAFANPGIIGNTGLHCVLAVSAAGVHGLVQDSIGYKQVVAAGLSAGAYALAQVRFDGSAIEARVGGGAWSSTASGVMLATTGTVLVGTNYSSSVFFDGQILAVGFSKVAFLSTGTLDGIRAFLGARYGLSL